MIRHASFRCPGKKGQGAEQQDHIKGHEIRRGHCPQDPQGKADQRAEEQRRGKSLTVHKFAPETGKQLQEEGPSWAGARATDGCGKVMGAYPYLLRLDKF